VSEEKSDLSKMSRDELLKGIKDGTIKSESCTKESSNHLGIYAYTIEIRQEDCVVKIHYNYNYQLNDIMEFEGRRLQSFYYRNMKLPSFDERVWDNDREITLRKRFK